MSTKMNQRQQGFSMVEAMVSVLVLSGGLLGLAFLQAQGMKFNADAYQRTQATVLAYDIIDRLRANPVAARAGNYVVANSAAAAFVGNTTSYELCDTQDGSVPCTANQLATFDLARWYQSQTTSLALDPNNYATIAQTVVGPPLDTYTITMRWREQSNLALGSLKTQAWQVQIAP